jgi:hypothetical protein
MKLLLQARIRGYDGQSRRSALRHTARVCLRASRLRVPVSLRVCTLSRRIFMSNAGLICGTYSGVQAEGIQAEGCVFRSKQPLVPLETRHSKCCKPAARNAQGPLSRSSLGWLLAVDEIRNPHDA